ncbi:MAG: hypothetical protein H6644_03210 [Caldilineaceae bacterium]|nr:hypothetical protein [Caldilineaceae bacterium]
MPIFTQAVTPSATVAAAHARFQQEIATWIAACMVRYAQSPATDVHDQGTYTTGWEPYIRATGDAAALAFLKTTRDRIRDHFEATGQWRHGYWTMQEAHHGTEHYELFLGMLLRLDPNDAETKRQLLDAAEHMGNWCDDVPPWFDHATNRFRSFFFGTDEVRTEPGDEFNRTDHLRGVNICLPAYAASDDRRYLDFAARYAGAWADAILAGPELPIGLMPDRPLYRVDDTQEAVYRAFVGEASAPATPVDRAENFLASDAVNTFLRLWRLTGDARFRRAAERLLDVLSGELAAPDSAGDAGAVAAAVCDYRTCTGSTRYDAAVLSGVVATPLAPVETIGLDTDFRVARRPAGVGKRSDMLQWLEDGAPRAHHPITLALAGEISGDDAYVIAALDRARVTFTLARDHLLDGRDHGCAARTVSAIARGHGRENHAGMVTQVWGTAGIKSED